MKLLGNNNAVLIAQVSRGALETLLHHAEQGLHRGSITFENVPFSVWLADEAEELVDHKFASLCCSCVTYRVHGSRAQSN